MDLTPDPLVERLGRTVRSRLAAVPHGRDAGTLDGVTAALREMQTAAFEAPVHGGGLDLGLVTGVVVCAELGRRALPDGYAGGALAVDALSAYGDVRDLVSAVVSGDLSVLAAGLDVTGDRLGPAGVPAAGRIAAGWELTGRVPLEEVRDEKAAVCVPVEADEEILLVLLAPDVWGERVTAAPGGVPVLDLTGVVVGEDDLVGGLGTGRPPSDPAGVLARARLRQAAYLMGLGEGARELAVAHARRRHQFGRPIMEFQAVAFPLAQATIALSAVRLCVHRAAWLADTGAGFAREAAEALAMAAETASRTVRHAVQVHGARGMSRQEPVHAFYTALRTEMTRFGRPGALWREAGARRLAAARDPVADEAVTA